MTAMSDTSAAAQSRRHHLEMSDLALDAGPSDPYEYRLGMFDALAAARWSALLDPGDRTIAQQLTRAGRFTVATAMSLAASDDAVVAIDGAARAVRSGLPDGALTTEQLANGLWAATAVGDARAAVYLSTFDWALLVPDAPVAIMPMADTLAAVWSQPSVAAARLISALEATVPSAASPGEADRLLSIIVPALRVVDRLLEHDRDGIAREIESAATEHLRYWANASHPELGAVSLELSGLATVARGHGVNVRAIGGVIPSGAVPPDGMVVLGCPACAHPVDELEPACWRCGFALGEDALLEDPFDPLGVSWFACGSCGRSNLAGALRCGSCATTID